MDRSGPPRAHPHAGRRSCGDWTTTELRDGQIERGRLSRGDAVGARAGGKPNPIDALAAGRVAIREGVETLPIARLEGRVPEIGLLLEDRDNVLAGCSDEQRLLCLHLDDLLDDFEIPADVWLEWIARRPARTERTARVRIARRLVRSTRADTSVIRQTEVEIAALKAARLLAEVGCEGLTAGKLIGEIAGADRYATDGEFVRAAGGAPVPATSDRRDRHRLDRGNRQLNSALLRLGVNKGRSCPETKVHLGRKQAEGKIRMNALRCLTRHLARRVHRLLTDPANGLDSSLALA